MSGLDALRAADPAARRWLAVVVATRAGVDAAVEGCVPAARRRLLALAFDLEGLDPIEVAHDFDDGVLAWHLGDQWLRDVAALADADDGLRPALLLAALRGLGNAVAVDELPCEAEARSVAGAIARRYGASRAVASFEHGLLEVAAERLRNPDPVASRAPCRAAA